MLINVFDHLDAVGKPDVQAALDAAQDGDRIYLPGAMVYRAPAGGFVIRKRVAFFGDGPGKKDSYWGTVLTPNGPNDPVIVLDAPDNATLNHLHLHDFQITRPQFQTARYGGDGIQYRQPTPPAEKKLSQLAIERVSVFHLSGTAFSLLGVNGGSSAIVDLHMLDCVADDCGGYGLNLRFAFGANVMHCLFKSNAKAGVRAEDSGVALYQCVLDGNTSGLTTNAEASLHFLDCHTARVEACRFLNFTVGAATGVVKAACIVSSVVGASGGALVMGGCYFEVAAGVSVQPGDGVVVPSSEFNGPVLFLPNRFLRASKLVNIGADVTGCVLFPQYDESNGTIVIPTSPNVGLVAVPSVNRSGANTVLGVVVPAAESGLPTLNLENGTMAWSGQQLSVYVADDWKTVQTGA